MSVGNVNSPVRRLVLAAVVVGVLVASVLLSRTAPRAEARTLAAAGDLKWYRGNMHTHSLWSDGDDFLENIALWYREHNYDFLVFTDHNVLPTSEKWIDIEKAKAGPKAFE